MGRELNQGSIHQIFGSVVDIKFAENNIPAIYEALEVADAGDESLVFEVQEQLENSIVHALPWVPQTVSSVVYP
jgi:F0F1-type ATP synthase beta subunit